MASKSTIDPINGAKWDRCLTDSVVKTVSGLAVGFLFSTLFFKGRPWPMFLSTGMGLGMAISNCRNDFRPSPLPLTRLDRHSPVKPWQSD